MDRLARAIAAIDAANAGDPHTLVVRGETRPKELAHAELMSEWIVRLDPGASDALQLAARAHHIRRWEIPRDSYPKDRAGYHRWRKALHGHHADALREILVAEGYEDETIDRAQAIVQKKGLGRDDEVQLFEDALCLVFVETQLRDLAEKTEPDKLLVICQKTLGKMSSRAIELALELPLEDADRELLLRAAAS